MREMAYMALTHMHGTRAAIVSSLDKKGQKGFKDLEKDLIAKIDGGPKANQMTRKQMAAAMQFVNKSK